MSTIEKTKSKVRLLINGFFNITDDKELLESKLDEASIEKINHLLLRQDIKLSFGVVGKAGAGKSTTLNTLFGLDLPVSDIESGTKEMIETNLSVKNDLKNLVEFSGIKATRAVSEKYEKFKKEKKKLGKGKCDLVIYDFPGLQYREEDDEKTLLALKEYLPECDIILWVVSALDRAILYDKKFINQLSDEIRSKLVIGISKVDIMPPSTSWRKQNKIPSPDQFHNIQEKKRFISKEFNIEISKVIEFSAQYLRYKERISGKNRRIDTRFNLYKLAEVLVHSCSKDHSYLLRKAFHSYILKKPKLRNNG